MLVPVFILLAFAGLLAYAARAWFRPAIGVHVAAVVPKAGAHTSGGASAPIERGPGPVLVQAPGWLEPAPYAVNVPALVEGVVQEVLALEGEHVGAGQPVAKLIDADETLRVRSAEALVAERESELTRMRAGVEQAASQVRVETVGAEELRPADDGGEWVPQFVREIGQELIFRPIGSLG